MDTITTCLNHFIQYAVLLYGWCHHRISPRVFCEKSSFASHFKVKSGSVLAYARSCLHVFSVAPSCPFSEGCQVVPERLQFLDQQWQLCGCHLLLSQCLSQPLHCAALLDWRGSKNTLHLTIMKRNYCFDLGNNKWSWMNGFLTQEVEDEEHCQQQQGDDGTAHGVGAWWAGCQHVLQTTLPLAAAAADRTASLINSRHVTGEEVSVRGGCVRWARGARPCN